MDVIALNRAGFTNAVAPLGTALTPKISSACYGRWLRSRRFASTATTAGKRPLIGRSTHRCRISSLGVPCNSPSCPRGAIRTTWSPAARRMPWRRRWREPSAADRCALGQGKDRHPLNTPEQRASLETASEWRRPADQAHTSLSFHYVSSFRRSGSRHTSGQRARIGMTPEELHGARATSRAARRRGEDTAVDRRGAHEQLFFQAPLRSRHAPMQRTEGSTAHHGPHRHPWLLDEHLEEIASLHSDDASCCRIRNAMLNHTSNDRRRLTMKNC